MLLLRRGTHTLLFCIFENKEIRLFDMNRPTPKAIQQLKVEKGQKPKPSLV
jgi:hypothetical protein